MLRPDVSLASTADRSATASRRANSFCFRSMFSGADSMARSTFSTVGSKALEESMRSQASRTSTGKHTQLRAGRIHALCGVLLAAAQDGGVHGAQRQRGGDSRAHHARADHGSGAETGFRHAVIVSEWSFAGVRAG